MRQAYACKRIYPVMALFLIALFIIVIRVFYLQIWQQDYLVNQGKKRYQRVINDNVSRGMITDTHGEPLAISTPIYSIWINPRQFIRHHPNITTLLSLIQSPKSHLDKVLQVHKKQRFVYLKRQVSPKIAQQLLDLNIPGVHSQKEYKRYYPAAQVTSHVIGFTNVDELGQEGIELAYNKELTSIAGQHVVLKDLKGRVIEQLEEKRTLNSGEKIVLSIDRRIQYLTYLELLKAVSKHRPKSAAIVVLDVWSGEVLSMMNYPMFNPNNRQHIQASHFRNRAVTDLFEPGSTMKPFTVAAALDAGHFKPNQVIDVNPGYFKVGRFRVKDHHNYKQLSIAKILHRSSNVGAVKLALGMPAKTHWLTLSRFGFGKIINHAFPGQNKGILTHYKQWKKVNRATIAYGYGVSVTALQLTQAYAALATDGKIRPVSFLKIKTNPKGIAAISPQTASIVRHMLEGVTSNEGTARRARIQGYRVAGKTGTTHIAIKGGYDRSRYNAIFAGIAPVSQPKLAIVVIINEPQGKQYYGGTVAAPIFSKIMAGSLRLLNIAPDAIDKSTHLANKG